MSGRRRGFRRGSRATSSRRLEGQPRSSASGRPWQRGRRRRGCAAPHAPAREPSVPPLQQVSVSGTMPCAQCAAPGLVLPILLRGLIRASDQGSRAQLGDPGGPGLIWQTFRRTQSEQSRVECGKDGLQEGGVRQTRELNTIPVKARLDSWVVQLSTMYAVAAAAAAAPAAAAAAAAGGVAIEVAPISRQLHNRSSARPPPANGSAGTCKQRKRVQKQELDASPRPREAPELGPGLHTAGGNTKGEPALAAAPQQPIGPRHAAQRFQRPLQ
mmetsp:Transcript_75685/g.246081  ORF Transcript_75685/g.246081 Transcript_75685/m.246081 type:complete len:271 (-) Transcript_75685:97-909(-)